MVSNTCTGATDWQSSGLMQGEPAGAYFSPTGSASGAKTEICWLTLLDDLVEWLQKSAQKSTGEQSRL